MLKKILFLLLTLKSFASQPEPFAVYTIPKSGSHLLIKTLYCMTNFTPQWHTTAPDMEKLFQESRFPYTHCCLAPPLFQYYNSSSIKQIIGIRDLRDVCVSIVYQIRKGVWPEFARNSNKMKEFKNLPFDEQLIIVIQQEYEESPTGIPIQLGIRKVAEQASLLVQNPNLLICRYEDLVGPRGGGSEDAQKELLRKIGSHIGLFLTPEQIDELSLSLYGDNRNPFGQGDFTDYQSTFREGKIGSWKSAFKDIHKEVFKKRLGKSLIALGYEKDDNW